MANENYALDFVGNYLVVGDVPFLDAQRNVRRAKLVSQIDIDVDYRAAAKDHTMYFVSEPAGIQPCDLDGQPIRNMSDNRSAQNLAQGLAVDRRFSVKPHGQDKYPDLYAKVRQYVNMLGTPVFEVDPDASARAPRVYEDRENEGPFEYLDTASTRAEIMAATQKLEGEVISIVGLGGSGSYVLDLVAKTPVREIRLFDGDISQVHNAFRCPGAPSADTLRASPKKVDYLAGIYRRMKKGISTNGYLTAENVHLLSGSTFVFVCIDQPAAKPPILHYLTQHGIPFSDVGMGLSLQGDSVRGSLRATIVRPGDAAALETIATAGHPDDVYRSNIQVAELNALAACLAVLQWKRLRGFYVDDRKEHETTYSVRMNAIRNEPQEEAEEAGAPVRGDNPSTA